jgi:hypothetical protein
MAVNAATANSEERRELTGMGWALWLEMNGMTDKTSARKGKTFRADGGMAMKRP